MQGRALGLRCLRSHVSRSLLVSTPLELNRQQWEMTPRSAVRFLRSRKEMLVQVSSREILLPDQYWYFMRAHSFVKERPVATGLLVYQQLTFPQKW